MNRSSWIYQILGRLIIFDYSLSSIWVMRVTHVLKIAMAHNFKVIAQEIILLSTSWASDEELGAGKLHYTKVKHPIIATEQGA